MCDKRAVRSTCDMSQLVLNHSVFPLPSPPVPSPLSSFFSSYLSLLTQTKSMVYEQELYNQFSYKRDRPYFHSFPGDVSDKVAVEFGALVQCLLPGGMCC